MNIAMLLALIVYISILLIIGFIASRHAALTQTNSTDFIVGNRSVNYWVTAISAHAADMSDWLFMGFPAAIYLTGAFSLWVAISLVFGMFISWQFVAPALRRATADFHATTLTSYFEAKYHENKGRISLLGAVIMGFFFTIYIAAGIKGVGYLLSTGFDVPYHVGTAIAIGVTISYVFMGGFIAAAWVDFFQGIFLLAVVLITPLFALQKIGGFAAIVNAAHARNLSLNLIPNAHNALGILLDPIAWGLGYLGMPHILSKFMGARDVNQMHKSKYIGLTWQIMALSGAALAGFVAMGFFNTILANPERELFISMALQLFNPFIAGLILCGILSATLSTMNSQMLVLAGVITDDLYKKQYKKNASTLELVWVFRCSILLIALAAFIVSWNEENTIFGLVQFAWSGLGASFGPLTMLSLYMPHITKQGALAGIFAGGITAVAWRMINPLVLGFHVNEMLPGFVIGGLVILMISWITRLSPSKHTTEPQI
ncbi:sodium:proline symporter [Candidatus Dependentiae bacterium Noda2021]|nr:sodium:proline symporter [Candidatus Dependentiae bacterium Noda2021]